MKKKLILVIAFAAVAVSAYAAIPMIRNGWNANGGRVFKTDTGTSILSIDTTGITSHLLTSTGSLALGGGTAITKRSVGTLAFAGDASKTATVSASTGGGYHITTGWQTNSADAYVKTAAISSTTMTITASAATTGTLSYEVTYW